MSETITQFVVLGSANGKAIKLSLAATPATNRLSNRSPHIDEQIDLAQYLIKNPDDTYYIQVVGNAMIGLGIYDRDILIIDRSLSPKHEDIIIIAINDKLICKRLEFINGSPYLIPNQSTSSSTPLESTDCYIWGVVTHNIHTLKTN